MGSGIFYPAANGDDGTYYGLGFGNTDEHLFLGWGGGIKYTIFLRFPNITIPQGSIITSCFIRFTARYTDNHIYPTNAPLDFNDIDDAVAPTDYIEANALVFTGNEVSWATTPWFQGSTYDTPDISVPFQAVINREGWSSGNAVLARSRYDTGVQTYSKQPSSIDYNSGVWKAELHVEWTDGGKTITSPTFTVSSSLTGEFALYPKRITAPTFTLTLSLDADLQADKFITAPAFTLTSTLTGDQINGTLITAPIFDLTFSMSASWIKTISGTLTLLNALEIGGTLTFLNELHQQHTGTFTLRNELTALNKLTGSLILKNRLEAATSGISRGEYYYDAGHMG